MFAFFAVILLALVPFTVYFVVVQLFRWLMKRSTGFDILENESTPKLFLSYDEIGRKPDQRKSKQDDDEDAYPQPDTASARLAEPNAAPERSGVSLAALLATNKDERAHYLDERD